MFTPGDKDLLARNFIAAIGLRLGLTAQCADIRAGMGLCQIHRAGPFSGNQLWQIERLQVSIGVMLQRLNLSLRQKRAEIERDAGAAHHVMHRGIQCHRKAHAAMLWGCGNADPSTFGNRRIAIGKARWGAHNAIFQLGRVQISGPLQRCHDRIAHLAAFA